MKTIKYNVFVLIFLSVFTLNAQTKLEKTSQSIKVVKDVTLNLNTNYCNIELDTWNKDVIEIEAYIEGEKLSKEELKQALKSWDLTIDATTNNVTITTQGGGYNSWNYNYVNGDNEAAFAIIEELKYELADIPEIHIEHLELPELPEMPELPELPEGISKLHFDYDAYKKDGDKYLDKWSENFDKKFGEGYAKKMEAWAKKFEEEWGEKYEDKMEAWGERYEEKMEAWAERFEKKNELLQERLEDRQERIAERQKKHNEKVIIIEKKRHQHRDREKLASKRRHKVELLMNNSSKVKKTIKIKMPKKAKVKINVRHGELKLASNINNLNADLSHTKLVANSINGTHTSINASYSPLLVKNWNYGKLNLNFVGDATLENVKSLILTTNSSNVKIHNLINNAVIDDNFGDLKILKLDDAFTNLNVISQNSKAFIVLPDTDYNLQYKGTNSSLKHPKKTSKKENSSFSTGNSNNTKRIIFNTKYSTIEMQ